MCPARRWGGGGLNEGRKIGGLRGRARRDPRGVKFYANLPSACLTNEAFPRNHCVGRASKDKGTDGFGTSSLNATRLASITHQLPLAHHGLPRRRAGPPPPKTTSRLARRLGSVGVAGRERLPRGGTSAIARVGL